MQLVPSCPALLDTYCERYGVLNSSESELHFYLIHDTVRIYHGAISSCTCRSVTHTTVLHLYVPPPIADNTTTRLSVRPKSVQYSAAQCSAVALASCFLSHLSASSLLFGFVYLCVQNGQCFPSPPSNERTKERTNERTN